ncbi:MAG: hypothetical protein KF838_08000 [Phycisphaeraceae bacterium]|nr:MAG: hypothetical protein KF838_08000 [Phycisphaeraceae bacterium]
MFDVEVDWKPYQEMHVGGSAEAQFFLYPPTLHLSEPAAGGYPWHKLPPGLERTEAVPLTLQDSTQPQP